MCSEQTSLSALGGPQCDDHSSFLFFLLEKKMSVRRTPHLRCDTAVGDPSLTILMALEVREQEGATPSTTSPNLQSLHVLQVVVYVAGSNSD